MAEKRDRRPRNEEQPELDEDVRDEERDEEFEDTDTEDEDEDLNEDIVGEEEPGEDRKFTAEIGSEGGSTGSVESRRSQSGVSRGSEATETGRPSADRWLPRERKRTDAGPA